MGSKGGGIALSHLEGVGSFLMYRFHDIYQGFVAFYPMIYRGFVHTSQLVVEDGNSEPEFQHFLPPKKGKNPTSITAKALGKWMLCSLSTFRGRLLNFQEFPHLVG